MITNSSKRIVVIGAGYAGMLATTRMAGKLKRELHTERATLTLVNASDIFVERLRLHQLAAGRPPAPRPIRDILLGSGVTFVQGRVDALDPTRRAIKLSAKAAPDPHWLGYDILLYALGSTTKLDAIPGLLDNVYVLAPSGTRSAPALRDALVHLNAAPIPGNLLVCGAGATGIEAAAELAQAYPNVRVRLITHCGFGQFTKPDIAGYMRNALDRLGVTISDRLEITSVGVNTAMTDTGETVPFDVCLWTGGFSVPTVAREAGLEVNDRGQIVIDPYMRSVSHPDIYAIGDAASPREAPGVAVRMAALTAAFMGAHGANCVTAAIKHNQPKPFSFAYVGQAISLGMYDAIGFNTFPSDVPNMPYFTGKLGSDVREFFVRTLANLPAIERRLPGALVWPGTGRYAAAQRKLRRIEAGAGTKHGRSTDPATALAESTTHTKP